VATKKELFQLCVAFYTDLRYRYTGWITRTVQYFWRWYYLLFWERKSSYQRVSNPEW